MKKLATMAISVGLIGAMVAGGSLAYLTSEDSDVNVMTLGNVKIEQIEQERDANGALVDFNQGKPAYPAVGPVEWAENGVDVNGIGYKVFTNDLKNVIDKIVTVKNTGKSDAYVRTIVAIEAPEGDPENLIHINYNSTGVVMDEGFVTEIDGVKYYITEFTYDKVLAPNEITAPSLMQLFLDSKADNKYCEKFGDTWEVLVVSQAVQADGFEDAATALDNAFGEISTENHPWIDATIADEIGITEGGTYDLKGDVYTIDNGYFHTQKVTEPVTINGNGATVNGIATSVDAFQWEGGTIPAMSAIFSSENGDKVTVNDITFTGTMSAVMAGHYVDSSSNWYNTEFNNVDIVDAEVVSFSSNISPALCAYGNLTMNNCNVSGTTLSPLDTDPMWPVYDVAAVNYSSVVINNSTIGSLYMWNQAEVTVANGSKVDTVVVRGNMNTTKYGLTVEAGANVETIDLSAITNKAKVNITIEDGATVGKVVANGVSYASIADWKNA